MQELLKQVEFWKTRCDVLGRVFGDAELVDRLLAVVPVLESRLGRRQADDSLMVLRRNVALHAREAPHPLSTASRAALRRAERGPRLVQSGEQSGVVCASAGAEGSEPRLVQLTPRADIDGKCTDADRVFVGEECDSFMCGASMGEYGVKKEEATLEEKLLECSTGSVAVIATSEVGFAEDAGAAGIRGLLVEAAALGDGGDEEHHVRALSEGDLEEAKGETGSDHGEVRVTWASCLCRAFRPSAISLGAVSLGSREVLVRPCHCERFARFEWASCEWECDQCGKDIHPQNAMWACHSCDFGLCAPCSVQWGTRRRSDDVSVGSQV